MRRSQPQGHWQIVILMCAEKNACAKSYMINLSFSNPESNVRVYESSCLTDLSGATQHPQCIQGFLKSLLTIAVLGSRG